MSTETASNDHLDLTVELASLPDEGRWKTMVFREVERVVGPMQPYLYETTTFHGGKRIEIKEAELKEYAARLKRDLPLVSIDYDHKSGRGKDGIAAGAMLPETAMVGDIEIEEPDGKGGRVRRRVKALLMRALYNFDAAREVKEGKWLGLSPRFAQMAFSKRDRSIGPTAINAALTNIPQLDDLPVIVDFCASATDSDAALDNATESVANTSEGVDAPPIHEDSTDMDTAKLAKALGMDGETDEEKLMGRIKSLMSDTEKKDKEMSAEFEELTSARDAASERAEKAEAEVAELSAKLESATSNLTDAEKQAAELAAKVEEFGARLDNSEKTLAAERAEAEVNDFALRLNLGAKEREFALKLRTSNVDLWNEWKADRESEGPSFQREFKGGNASDDGEAGTLDWVGLLDKVKKENEFSDDREATEFALQTEDGQRLFDAYMNG